MSKLRASGFDVFTGMEFIAFPQQAETDLYRQGQLSEQDFLKQIQWGSFDFSLYREQILFPEQGAQCFALNSPRDLTRQVSRGGLSSLSPEQRLLLPPHLERGNPAYYERFRQVMEGHLPNPEALERYFWAQSIWDDTMAWKVAEALDTKAWKEAQKPVLVVVVGDFHVVYGGGFPDRLRRRGVSSIVTLSQIDGQGMSEDEISELQKPSPVDGPRADFVWILSNQPKL